MKTYEYELHFDADWSRGEAQLFRLFVSKAGQQTTLKFYSLNDSDALSKEEYRLRRVPMPYARIHGFDYARRVKIFKLTEQTLIKALDNNEYQMADFAKYCQ